MQECPFFEPIIEDESHVLHCCPRYSGDRQKLKEVTRQLMQSASGITEIFADTALVKDLARFLKRCHSAKFPENSPKDRTETDENPVNVV